MIFLLKNSKKVDKNHLFGYVYFRQVKDKTLKRGYFQKVKFLSLISAKSKKEKLDI